MSSSFPIPVPGYEDAWCPFKREKHHICYCRMMCNPVIIPEIMLERETLNAFKSVYMIKSDWKFVGYVNLSLEGVSLFPVFNKDDKYISCVPKDVRSNNCEDQHSYSKI